MNTVSTLGAAAIGAALVLGAQVGGTRPPDEPGAAETYEHLANAIIAIRETEDSLVRDMLTDAYDDAMAELDDAADTTGGERKAHLESAAMDVTEIATEGDKRVQAIRQRLLRAGHHHHHTEADTESDYIFIDAKEKQSLLDLARTISQIGPNASEREVLDASRELRSLFSRAMAAE